MSAKKRGRVDKLRNITADVFSIWLFGGNQNSLRVARSPARVHCLFVSQSELSWERDVSKSTPIRVTFKLALRYADPLHPQVWDFVYEIWYKVTFQFFIIYV